MRHPRVNLQLLLTLDRSVHYQDMMKLLEDWEDLFDVHSVLERHAKDWTTN